jgi:hypothetical protein
MTRVADYMADKFLATKQCQGKCKEKRQLEHDISTYYISVCTLPESTTAGNFACVFMNSKPCK